MKKRTVKIIIAMVLIVVCMLVITACDSNQETRSKNSKQNNNVEEKVDKTKMDEVPEENETKKDSKLQDERNDSQNTDSKSSKNNSKKESIKKENNKGSTSEKSSTNENKKQPEIEEPKEKEPIKEQEKKKYTITYKKSTHTNGNVPSVQVINEGETATLAKNSTIQKSVLGTAYFLYCYNGCNGGNDFYLNSYKVHKPNGWSKTINSNNCEYSSGQDISLNGNLVLYACYLKEEEVEGATFPTPTNPNGMKFGGWYTGPNCSRTKLNEYQGSQPMTFYACWEQ